MFSSSSSSYSTFEIALGGLESVEGFLLKGLYGFLEEVSATCFLISTISLDMVFKTFCNPSKSNGSLGRFFLGSSLKETFLDFQSSITFFFSRVVIRFSTAIASFIFSTKVVLLALSTKIAKFDGKAAIYHSLRTSSLG